MATRVLTACAGFLLAVLWFDLMFDVQVLRQRVRNALHEPGSPRSKTASRELLRMIRAAWEAQRPMPPGSDG